MLTGSAPRCVPRTQICIFNTKQSSALPRAARGPGGGLAGRSALPLRGFPTTLWPGGGGRGLRARVASAPPATRGRCGTGAPPQSFRSAASVRPSAASSSSSFTAKRVLAFLSCALSSASFSSSSSLSSATSTSRPALSFSLPWCFR